ncbi:hypothetical protein HYH03_017599 [Edaphochlamys debaryana]|uniref:Uncharacterized protein n=1 Tax=Edaphochlamys debaryana TaxID=47281 RepID=A0A835XM80_9CHLO|nr:hypothetical protein HYH03_017599 [Edaphochlamys debaryana]|eukprot:KAG2483545.1 hypothetical protein HYH03_017599 [Edaphochlamys debaryana]
MLSLSDAGSNLASCSPALNITTLLVPSAQGALASSAAELPAAALRAEGAGTAAGARAVLLTASGADAPAGEGEGEGEGGGGVYPGGFSSLAEGVECTLAAPPLAQAGRRVAWDTRGMARQVGIPATSNLTVSGVILYNLAPTGSRYPGQATAFLPEEGDKVGGDIGAASPPPLAAQSPTAKAFANHSLSLWLFDFDRDLSASPLSPGPFPLRLRNVTLVVPQAELDLLRHMLKQASRLPPDASAPAPGGPGRRTLLGGALEGPPPRGRRVVLSGLDDTPAAAQAAAAARRMAAAESSEDAASRVDRWRGCVYTHLVWFAAESRVVSASSDTLVFSSLRHYGWRGSDVTVTSALPPDTPTLLLQAPGQGGDGEVIVIDVMAGCPVGVDQGPPTPTAAAGPTDAAGPVLAADAGGSGGGGGGASGGSGSSSSAGAVAGAVVGAVVAGAAAAAVVVVVLRRRRRRRARAAREEAVYDTFESFGSNPSAPPIAHASSDQGTRPGGEGDLDAPSVGILMGDDPVLPAPTRAAGKDRRSAWGKLLVLGAPKAKAKAKGKGQLYPPAVDGAGASFGGVDVAGEGGRRTAGGAGGGGGGGFAAMWSLGTRLSGDDGTGRLSAPLQGAVGGSRGASGAGFGGGEAGGQGGTDQAECAIELMPEAWEEPGGVGSGNQRRRAAAAKMGTASGEASQSGSGLFGWFKSLLRRAQPSGSGGSLPPLGNPSDLPKPSASSRKRIAAEEVLQAASPHGSRPASPAERRALAAGHVGGTSFLRAQTWVTDRADSLNDNNSVSGAPRTADEVTECVGGGLTAPGTPNARPSSSRRATLTNLLSAPLEGLGVNLGGGEGGVKLKHRPSGGHTAIEELDPAHVQHSFVVSPRVSGAGGHLGGGQPTRVSAAADRVGGPFEPRSADNIPRPFGPDDGPGVPRARTSLGGNVAFGGPDPHGGSSPGRPVSALRAGRQPGQPQLLHSRSRLGPGGGPGPGMGDATRSTQTHRVERKTHHTSVHHEVEDVESIIGEVLGPDPGTRRAGPGGDERGDSGGSHRRRREAERREEERTQHRAETKVEETRLGGGGEQRTESRHEENTVVKTVVEEEEEEVTEAAGDSRYRDAGPRGASRQSHGSRYSHHTTHSTHNHQVKTVTKTVIINTTSAGAGASGQRFGAAAAAATAAQPTRFSMPGGASGGLSPDAAAAASGGFGSAPQTSQAKDQGADWARDRPHQPPVDPTQAATRIPESAAQAYAQAVASGRAPPPYATGHGGVAGGVGPGAGAGGRGVPVGRGLQREGTLTERDLATISGSQPYLGPDSRTDILERFLEDASEDAPSCLRLDPPPMTPSEASASSAVAPAKLYLANIPHASSKQDGDGYSARPLSRTGQGDAGMAGPTHPHSNAHSRQSRQQTTTHHSTTEVRSHKVTRSVAGNGETEQTEEQQTTQEEHRTTTHHTTTTDAAQGGAAAPVPENDVDAAIAALGIPTTGLVQGGNGYAVGLSPPGRRNPAGRREIVEEVVERRRVVIRTAPENIEDVLRAAATRLTDAGDNDPPPLIHEKSTTSGGGVRFVEQDEEEDDETGGGDDDGHWDGTGGRRQRRKRRVRLVPGLKRGQTAGFSPVRGSSMAPTRSTTFKLESGITAPGDDDEDCAISPWEYTGARNTAGEKSFISGKSLTARARPELSPPRTAGGNRGYTQSGENALSMAGAALSSTLGGGLGKRTSDGASGPGADGGAHYDASSRLLAAQAPLMRAKSRTQRTNPGTSALNPLLWQGGADDASRNARYSSNPGNNGEDPSGHGPRYLKPDPALAAAAERAARVAAGGYRDLSPPGARGPAGYRDTSPSAMRAGGVAYRDTSPGRAGGLTGRANIEFSAGLAGLSAGLAGLGGGGSVARRYPPPSRGGPG